MATTSTRSVSEIIQLASQKGAAYTKDEFPELKTFLFWLRVVLAVTAGLIAGVTGTTGSLGFGAGAGAIVALPIAYYTAYLEVDVEDYGSQELLMEGAMPGVAVFVLLWTGLFNALHL